MSNLPDWPGAASCYQRAYALLARKAPDEVKRVYRRGRPVCVPSDEMHELIAALNEGKEETIKGLLLEYYA